MNADTASSYATELSVLPASPRLLVIDHQPSFTGFLRLVAQRLGYHVSVLPDSREIATSLDACRPNLLVLEVVMPELDYIEVISILRRKGFDGRLILVSGHEPAYLELARKAAEANSIKVAATLMKPIRQATMETVLRESQIAHQTGGESANF